jgi:hypothetical protein
MSFRAAFITCMVVGWGLVGACGGTTGGVPDASSDVIGTTDTGPTCANGQTLCGTSCTNTAFDPQNCGMCGNACASGSTCASSACTTVETLCSSDAGAPYYANLQTDNANCGACDNACQDPQACSHGHCCGAGLTYCGAACVSTRSDSMNCGGCGNACSAGSSCLDSTCVAIPTSCRDLLVSQGVLTDAGIVDGGSAVYPDGNYVIDPDGTGPIKPFVVYCLGMDTETPAEYLTLLHSSATGEPGSNFTMLAPGGACGTTCTGFYRQFTRVRLLPATLEVDSTDLTFGLPRDATETACWSKLGGACGATWQTLAWGNGWDCACSGANGTANIDLRDTGFSIDPAVTFTPSGYNPTGSSMFDTARDTANVTGGGCCGGDGPPALVQLKQN